MLCPKHVLVHEGILTYFRITGFLCNNLTITQRLNGVFLCLLMFHFLKQKT